MSLQDTRKKGGFSFLTAPLSREITSSSIERCMGLVETNTVEDRQDAPRDIIKDNPRDIVTDNPPASLTYSEVARKDSVAHRSIVADRSTRSVRPGLNYRYMRRCAF
mmetsp:Transcript_31527/g.48377  ORF Transcript_31527/g.48377 Transcript_31527/m.48377 type:complete len:107 (-) Transcript_31527:36-356(-)